MLSYCFNQALWFSYENIPVMADLLQSTYTDSFLRIFRAVWWLLVVFCFARTDTLQHFAKKAGLDRGPICGAGSQHGSRSELVCLMSYA